LSSAETPDAPEAGAAAGAPPQPEPEVVDEARKAVLDALTTELGDAIVASFIRADDDLWVRIKADAWATAGEALRHQLHYGYFCFLSAIDWRPSPFGRYEDAEVDSPFADKLQQPFTIETGITGGDTRYQVFARLRDPRTHQPDITLKVDVPDDSMSIPTWQRVYAGADWHERETWEMFGITFAGHTDLRHIYLPTEFEGFPLRKDFPLLARVVKPWPGIVDVEPMPGEPAGDDEDETADAPA
jgi:NADH-quinone oxidoreductase subunit C